MRRHRTQITRDIASRFAADATVPIYDEPRIVKLIIDEKGAQEAEKKIAEAAAADENGWSLQHGGLQV